METVAFSQRDPRWAGDLLGTSQYTLGQAGCLVTAAAGMLATWGMVTDPHRLNEFLRRSSGYVDDCLLLFAALDGMGARFEELIDCYRAPAPMARLAAALGAGVGCLAMVDAQPGGTVQPHWVWVVADNWQIVDPWQLPGHELIDMRQYLASGWKLDRGIFLVALYAQIDMRARHAWKAIEGPVQPAVCLR